ncbi:SDR family NAD(P)-dependent oxidoreductase [Albimonas sp. CAU 1670]|uniref:SDR family NAD(P)-dependent oxidoreductase n=1 Tax=Albimonas sp. CAU 1670 TaxID=3032599 RepID=UPI0023DB347F|nr:SDR family NAD(P)-dependent oxidoreductase [Albimonas sp. CAU 1670]MDF2232609.1 SDR family NAD(P)-dependent oxidoreductase [Albimonas sp. CAU 1670]
MSAYRPFSRSVAGRVAFVTGAGSGMGRATAHLFAREGARVVAADLHDASVQAVAAEIDAARAGDPSIGEVLPLAFDVADAEAGRAAMATVEARFGGLDMLINNAGFLETSALDAEDYDRVWSRTLEVMLTAHQRLIRAALPLLRRSDCARIVNISSTDGLGASPRHSPYTAAKHGVIGLTRALAVDLGPEGITVNAVCPGPVRTAITEAIPEEHKAIFVRRRVPLRRYAEPEEVAHATLSLCLPAAGYITGAAIPVDGGMTIRNA